MLIDPTIPAEKNKDDIGWQIFKASFSIIQKNSSLFWLVIIIGLLESTTIGAVVFLIFKPAFIPLFLGLPSSTLNFWFIGLVIVAVLIPIIIDNTIINLAYSAMTDKKLNIFTCLGNAIGKFPKRLIAQLIGSRADAVLTIGAISKATWAAPLNLLAPIIVLEKVSILGSITKARDLFQKTWSHKIISRFGYFSVMFMGLQIIGLLLAVSCFYITGKFAPSIVLFTTLGSLTGIFIGALTSILTTALYIYASTSQAPSGFTAPALQNFFTPTSNILAPQGDTDELNKIIPQTNLNFSSRTKPILMIAWLLILLQAVTPLILINAIGLKDGTYSSQSAFLISHVLAASFDKQTLFLMVNFLSPFGVSSQKDYYIWLFTIPGMFINAVVAVDFFKKARRATVVYVVGQIVIIVTALLVLGKIQIASLTLPTVTAILLFSNWRNKQESQEKVMDWRQTVSLFGLALLIGGLGVASYALMVGKLTYLAWSLGSLIIGIILRIIFEQKPASSKKSRNLQEYFENNSFVLAGTILVFASLIYGFFAAIMVLFGGPLILLTPVVLVVFGAGLMQHQKWAFYGFIIVVLVGFVAGGLLLRQRIHELANDPQGYLLNWQNDKPITTSATQCTNSLDCTCPGSAGTGGFLPGHCCTIADLNEIKIGDTGRTIPPYPGCTQQQYCATCPNRNN